jgi:CheY-like chemotaxis protein
MTTVHRPTVLLVQPAHDDRDMYVEFLTHIGLRVVAVTTAADGLASVRAADLVVTGVLLPGSMDGIEFITRLKGDARMTRVPVIALTVCVGNTERDRALGAGCDRFLSKPCLPHVLAREIRRLLARRAPKRRAASRAA